MDIAEFAEFTVGVFLVPKGQRLPLHDHPGMTVMSKVLYGTLAITSFDKRDSAGQCRHKTTAYQLKR